jgi:hypothetical protein
MGDLHSHEDEIIQKELSEMSKMNEDRIGQLNSHLKMFKDLESEFKNLNIDWSSLAHKVKDFEETKENMEYLNQVRKKTEFLERIYSDVDKENKIIINSSNQSNSISSLKNILKEMLEILNSDHKIQKQSPTPTNDTKIWFECLNKITKNNRNYLDKILVDLKFPIFEGFSSITTIEEFRKNNFSQYEDFNLYIEILHLILNSENESLKNVKNSNSLTYLSNNQEYIFLFLFKKILYTIINPYLSPNISSKDDFQFEKDLIEFFTLLINYLSKALHNTFDFLHIILSGNKEKAILIINYIIQNLIYQINSIFINNQRVVKVLQSRNDIYVKVIKLISKFHKTIKKEFSFEILGKNNLSNLSLFDIVSDSSIFSEEILREKIKLQKSFTQNFIKTQIKEKLTSTIEKNEYINEEIFDMIKMIIKDNYQFSVCFKNNFTVLEYSLENNLCFSLREILNVYRSAYNEEIQIFSLRKTVSRKKIIFILDLIIKYLIYINKLNTSFIPSSSKESFNQIISEINKLIENYSQIINKDLRSNGFDELINLFTYDNLIKLQEEKLNENFNKLKSLINSLFNELDYIKVSIESENYFLNSLLLTIINKISEELEKSLKRLPKGKNLRNLTEKSTKLIDSILNRYTVSQTTLMSTKMPYKKLKEYFSLLNMNKI